MLMNVSPKRMDDSDASVLNKKYFWLLNKCRISTQLNTDMSFLLRGKKIVPYIKKSKYFLLKP